MAEVNIGFVGLDELIKKFEKIKTKLPGTVAESFNTSHGKIMIVAKERTPVDTGALQKSGIVRTPEITGDTIKSVGAFGGPTSIKNVDYALAVHEDLSVFHNTGQAKFFESAAEDSKEDVVNQLNVDISKLIESG